MISIYPKKNCFATPKYPFYTYRISKFSSISKYISSYIWSPVIFKNHTRLQANFLWSSLLVFDFDNDDGVIVSMDSAVNNIFADMRHIIATTRNHQKWKGSKPPQDRYRVILQFSKPITTLRDYRYNLKHYVTHYESDSKPKDGARLFFPCSEIISINDGYLVDVLNPPPQFMNNDAKDSELAAYAKLGRLPIWLERNLARVVQEGHRNEAVFCMASDIAKVKRDPAFVLSHIKKSRVWNDHINDHEFINGALRTITGIFERKGL